MNDKSCSNLGRSTPDHAEPPSSSPNFDRWLERKLHDMFNSIAAEPVPSDLLNLVKQLDEKERELTATPKDTKKTDSV